MFWRKSLKFDGLSCFVIVDTQGLWARLTKCLGVFKSLAILKLHVLLQSTDEEDFSETARVFVEQVAQSFAILQGQVTSYSEDGVPFVELFYTDSERRVHYHFLIIVSV